jgi:hypothetical protein
MNRVCSIFSQILQLIPRLSFEAKVREHRAERHARGFGSWTQLIAMLFGQLGHAQSLREITGGLAACEGKLRHLGVSDPPKRSTLSYANEHRPWELYRSVFYDLVERCQGEAAGHKRKFRFKHKLLSIDSTTIALSLSMFDWAQYKRSKGAVKLHRVFSVRMRDESRRRLLPSINSGEGAVINEIEPHRPATSRGAGSSTRFRRLAKRSFTSHPIPRRTVGRGGKSSDTIWNLPHG